METNICPLSVRRKDLTLRYYLKVRGDGDHPCRGIVDMTTHDRLYGGLSQQYIRRVSGFPMPCRLSRIFEELQYQPPMDVQSPKGTISPWRLPPVSAHMLLDNPKAHVTEADISAMFLEKCSQFPGYRVFFTDGSKQNGSTACAFTVNSVFSSHKLHPALSVFTAELFAIREALHFIHRHRVEKSLICSDSQSAVRAISSQKRNHCVLIDIAELLYELARNDFKCVFLWIPGHSGIAGNVRADYWAKRAHDKPTLTPVPVGYQEYIPQVC